MNEVRTDDNEVVHGGPEEAHGPERRPAASTHSPLREGEGYSPDTLITVLDS